jgi:hypothetical protein
MKPIIKVAIASIFFANCTSANKMSKVIVPDIDSTHYSASECFPFLDSTNYTVWVIFERGFSAQAEAFINKIKIDQKELKTNETLGVCKESFLFRLQKKNYTSSIITIVYRGKEVRIKPILYKPILYVNLFKEVWSVEASDCLRQYH